MVATAENCYFFSPSLSLTKNLSSLSTHADSASRERARQKSSRSTSPKNWTESSMRKPLLPRKNNSGSSSKPQCSRRRRLACCSADTRSPRIDGGSSSSLSSLSSLLSRPATPPPTRPCCGSPSGQGSPRTRPAWPGSGAPRASRLPPCPRPSCGRRPCRSRGRSTAARGGAEEEEEVILQTAPRSPAPSPERPRSLRPCS